VAIGEGLAQPGINPREAVMAPERWQLVKSIFDRVVECDPAVRDELLKKECGDDQELLEEVQKLLASDKPQTDSVLVSPVGSGLGAALAQDPIIGREIGPYRVLREIGRGGMGCVYLAQRADDKFRRRVALKTVNPSLVDKHSLRRFENERQTMAMLDHPNIIKLLDGGTTEDGLPWLAMDYVEGQTIDSYCETHKLDIAERLALFRTICGAVHYAHQNLVIHRDLKPSNILITADGLPKLLDFGIAKLLRPEFSLHTVGQTRTELQPMTLQFASPEQVRGLPITTASDIYSLGVLLYYLITGKHPFTATTTLDLEHAICETEPQRPSTVVHQTRPDSSARRQGRISGDLDQIILMALRKEPQRRYASAEHFSEDVRRFLEGRPVLARKDTWTYRVSKLVARHRAVTTVVATASVALLVTGLVALQEYRQSQRRTRELRLFTEAVLNMDKGLQSGLTAARAKMLGKTVESLDNIAKDSSGDPELQRDLVRAYIQLGDVEGNAQNANLGQAAAAQALYEKARTIADDLLRKNPDNKDDITQLALVNEKLGEMASDKGDYAKALIYYNVAQQSREKILALDPSSSDALKPLLSSFEDLATTYDRLGDPAGALERYRHCLELLRQAPKPDAGSLAYVQRQIGYFSVKSGEPENGEGSIRGAIETFQRIAGPKPSPRDRWNLAQSYMTLSDALKLTGKTSEAVSAMKQSFTITEGLAAEDPTNAQFRGDLYTTLAFLVDLDLQAGQKQEAHEYTLRAMRLLKPLIDKGEESIYPVYYYTWILTRTPFPDQQNHAEALACAKRGAQLTHNSDPEFLQLLARAYENVGDHAQARVTLEKALSLLPPVKPGRPVPKLRQELEADLKKYSG
jgi:eukaryotic-like serine/threonine-protein kinase